MHVLVKCMGLAALIMPSDVILTYIIHGDVSSITLPKKKEEHPGTGLKECTEPNGITYSISAFAVCAIEWI